MIGLLRGLVVEIGEEEALIDVAGVGYVVRCGARTLARLPAAGEATTVRIEAENANHVRHVFRRNIARARPKEKVCLWLTIDYRLRRAW